MLSMVFIGLYGVSRIQFARNSFAEGRVGKVAYKWKSAICALADLRLVEVDEDSGMSQWAASSIARYLALVRPSDRLLVDKLNGSLWARLADTISIEQYGIPRHIQPYENLPDQQ